MLSSQVILKGKFATIHQLSYKRAHRLLTIRPTNRANLGGLNGPESYSATLQPILLGELWQYVKREWREKAVLGPLVLKVG